MPPRITAIILGALAMAAAPAAAETTASPQWSLMIHGGAGTMAPGTMTKDQEAGYRAALDRALDAGSAVLKAGGSAVDAVQAAVVVLEDDPRFNAGKGAVFTYEGVNDLDAAIMDGNGKRAGAVAQTRFTKNPVKLARVVMDKGGPVMLAAGGADVFSRENGLEQVPNSYFATPERREQLEQMKAKEASGEKTSAFDIEMKFGTVGAVAMDAEGHLAAATSTGGLTGKRWGRIGDSPILGAGTWAEDGGCAVSATGAGEYFIRIGVAHEICARMRLKGEDAATAANAVIGDLGTLGGTGGVIVVAPGGKAAWHFNTSGMYRGRADSTGARSTAIYKD